MKKLQLVGKWIGERTSARIALVIGKYLAFLGALYVTIGLLIYPDWWRLFLWGGGCLERRVWRLGWVTLKEEAFSSFWPFGGVVLMTIIFIGFRIMYKLGKQGDQFWKDGRGLDILPRWAFFATLAGCFVAMLLLLPREPQNYDEFWLGREFLRGTFKALDEASRNFAGEERGVQAEFEPPSSGVFLYLNDDLILRQYQALMAPLILKEKREKSSKERGIRAEAGAVSASGSSAKETETIKEAPPVSAPFAAQRLITQFGKSVDAVKINAFTAATSRKATSLTNDLMTFGVELTVDQLRQLDEGERKHYMKQMLKVDRARIIFFRGSVVISRGKAETSFTIRAFGPMEFFGTGVLKPSAFGDHLSLGVQSTKPEITMGTSLYGVIETSTTTSNLVEATITPYAMW